MEQKEHTRLANWLTRCRAIISQLENAQGSLNLDLYDAAYLDLEYAMQEAKQLESEINLRCKVLHAKLQKEIPF